MKKELITISSDELAKVDNNSLNSQQLKFMLRKTPKEHIYTRPAKGGGTWNYVTGTYVKKVLNIMFGWDWDFEIIEYKYDLEYRQVFVLGKLTCRTNGKTIIKTQFGRQDIKFKTEYRRDSNGNWIMQEKHPDRKQKFPTNIPLDLGNDLKAAATDCLKKCASEIGIASDVYAPNEFKEINVIDGKAERKRLAELKKKIGDLLDENQDKDEKQAIIDMIIAKEDAGEDTIEFYENLIADQLSKKL